MKYIIAALGLMLAFSAHAVDYVKLGYVDTDLNVDAPFDASFGDDANGLTLRLGHGLNSWLALELGYTDYGDSNESTTTSNDCAESLRCVPSTHKEQFTYEGRSLGLYAVGGKSDLFTIREKVDIGAYAKVGIVVAQSEAELRFSGENYYGTYDEDVHVDDTGVGTGYGLGVTVGLSNFGAFVEWNKVDVPMVYAGEDVSFDPETIVAGISYAF